MRLRRMIGKTEYKYYWFTEDAEVKSREHTVKNSTHINIGDKLNIGTEVWTTSTPANIIHGFLSTHPHNGPYIVCKTRRLLLPSEEINTLDRIREYITLNPKQVYYRFIETVYNGNVDFLAVQSWKNETFEEEFDQLKKIPENAKNIVRI